jgi:hypothetical protein
MEQSPVISSLRGRRAWFAGADLQLLTRQGRRRVDRVPAQRSAKNREQGPDYERLI